jgi:CRP-like cAMP-binding protein
MDDLKLKFEQIFNYYANFQKAALDELFSLLEIKTIDQCSDIFIQGKSNTKDYFLLDGILREYTIDNDGNDITFNFYSKESMITPNFCRTRNFLCMYSLQNITKCTIGMVDASEIERMRMENKAFSDASVLIITMLFKNKLQKQITHATQSATERLAQFRKDFPGLENQIPHPYIASYLGITNVSLSRLRKQK